jgi:hypothetical protein
VPGKVNATHLVDSMRDNQRIIADVMPALAEPGKIPVYLILLTAFERLVSNRSGVLEEHFLSPTSIIRTQYDQKLLLLSS